MCTERKASRGWRSSAKRESRWIRKSSTASRRSEPTSASRGPRDASTDLPLAIGDLRVFGFSLPKGVLPVAHHGAHELEEVFETMPEEEFLGELSEKTTSVTIKEFTPDGVLISYNLQGTQKGQYDATHMETVDALFKPDGTYEFEARGIDQTNDGDMVLTRAKGIGKTVSPTSVHAEGEATYQTLSKKLGWLNSAKGRFEGTYDLSTGEFVAKIFAQK